MKRSRVLYSAISKRILSVLIIGLSIGGGYAQTDGGDLIGNTVHCREIAVAEHTGNEPGESGAVELLTAALDADNDQMPDPWGGFEAISNHDCDPEANDDGDGVINWIEYQVGADPQTADLPGTGLHYEYDALGRVVRIVRIPE